MEPQDVPFTLTNFSISHCSFRDRKKGSPGGVSVRAVLLAPHPFIPFANYVVKIVEGELDTAWLRGELTGFNRDHETSTTTLHFSSSRGIPSKCDFTVEVTGPRIWSCQLVAGRKYSLIAQPVEMAADSGPTI